MVDYLAIIANILLSLSGLVGAYFLYRARQSLSIQAMVTAVTLGLSGLYGSLALLAYGLNLPIKEVAYLFSNIHLYISAPLIFLALLDQCVGWNFSRPIWGRILLGLCAFFELFRRGDILNEYTLALNIIYTLGFAGIAFWKKQPWLLLASAAWGLHLVVAWSGWAALAMFVMTFHYLHIIKYTKN
jgi:hypothetical protein